MCGKTQLGSLWPGSAPATTRCGGDHTGISSSHPFNLFFFSSRRRHTRFDCDWSSDVCSSDLFTFAIDFDRLLGITNCRQSAEFMEIPHEVLPPIAHANHRHLARRLIIARYASDRKSVV